MAISDFYTTLTLESYSTTPNGMGGFSKTWSTKSTIQGLINNANSNEINIADQFNIKASHKLYTHTSYDISNIDRIKDASGLIYEIVSINKNTCNKNHHYKILLDYYGVDN